MLNKAHARTEFAVTLIEIESVNSISDEINEASNEPKERSDDKKAFP